MLAEHKKEKKELLECAQDGDGKATRRKIKEKKPRNVRCNKITGGPEHENDYMKMIITITDLYISTQCFFAHH